MLPISLLSTGMASALPNPTAVRKHPLHQTRDTTRLLATHGARCEQHMVARNRHAKASSWGEKTLAPDIKFQACHRAPHTGLQTWQRTTRSQPALEANVTCHRLQHSHSSDPVGTPFTLTAEPRVPNMATEGSTSTWPPASPEPLHDCIATHPPPTCRGLPWDPLFAHSPLHHPPS